MTGLVKYFEPAENKFEWQIECSVNSLYNHPDRYRITSVITEYRDGVLYCRNTGREGWFPFHDAFCPRFLGYYPAVFLRHLNEDENPDDFKSDVFLPY